MIRPILGNVYVGDCSSTSDFEYLEHLGIKRVINVHAQHLDPPLNGIELHLVPLVEAPGNRWSDIKRIVALISEGVRRGGVLVHCCGGMSRSPFSILAYLVLERKMTFEAASKFLCEKHPMTNIHPALLDMLNSKLKKTG